MTACERCWGIAQALGIEYAEQLRRADNERQPCIAFTEEGARLRAGQFWDESRKIDSRRSPEEQR